MTSRYVARPTVTIDGTALSEQVDAVLTRTVVDLHTHLPDMVVLEFTGTDPGLVTSLNVRFGSRIVVATAATANGALTPLCTAEVTAIEQEVDGCGARVVIRGYDPIHRLCRGRNTRTFADVGDGDILRQVATAAGLQVGDVDSDGITYDYVSQVNQTDWDFLRGRARAAGRHLVTVDGTLAWQAPADSADAPAAGEVTAPPEPLQLLLGRDLLRLRPRVTAAEQVSEVQVRGWDPQAKRAVLGTAPATTPSVAVGVSPAALAATFSAAPYVVVDRSVATQQEAESMARAVATQIAGAHAEAEGTAFGDPRLRPGAAVRIGQVGWPHDGSYVLTASRHIYDETGYWTDFTVSGGQERSLIGLASGGAARGRGDTIPGLVIGQVTDASDPEGQFRVRVSFPWLADDYESWWCRVAQPGAGASRGLVWLPEVGDEVLVGFAHGDAQVPFVVGSLYNGVDAPPLADDLIDSASGEVVTRGLVSRSNHRVVFADGDSDQSITLSTGDGGMTIVLDQTNTAITVDSQGTVTVHGAQGVKITSDADLSLTAQGSLSLSGQSGISIDGGPSVSVSGSVIKLN